MENLLLTATLESGDYVGFTFFIGSMAMLAATVFFFLEMKSVSGKWRTSLLVSGLITLIAAVHYYYMRDFWVENKTILLDLSHKGFSSVHLPGHELKNLNFGLAKAEKLPFRNESQDFVFSNFLLDRLKQPLEGLKEMKRVLKRNGKIIIITPLNFLHKDHWQQFYPSVKLLQVIREIGFNVLEWEDNFTIEEPLDLRGNALKWNCIGMVLQKS